MRTYYLLKNKKNNIYYSNFVTKGLYHFVRDITEAKMFVSKRDANRMLKNFNNPDNFEIIGYKREK